jgi:hypothetical protein
VFGGHGARLSFETVGIASRIPPLNTAVLDHFKVSSVGIRGLSLRSAGHRADAKTAAVTFALIRFHAEVRKNGELLSTFVFDETECRLGAIGQCESLVRVLAGGANAKQQRMHAALLGAVKDFGSGGDMDVDGPRCESGSSSLKLESRRRSITIAIARHPSWLDEGSSPVKPSVGA